MSEPARRSPDERDRRTVRWGGWRRPGTSGALGVTGGRLGASYAAILAVILVVTTVNVLSRIHDQGRGGHAASALVPLVDEITSGAIIFATASIVIAAALIAPPRPRRWLSFLTLHAAATLVFSLTHIFLMGLSRTAAYAMFHIRYALPLSDYPYEYRKDVITYAAIAVTFWLFRSLPPAGTRPGSDPTPATFDILDGGRTFRIPVDDIVAAKSAGNYVDFHLAAGPTRMMRTTLAEAERALAPHGFVRIHRSWIANTRRLRLLEPSGSGDYRLVLDGGVEAPVSRRYPQALARLRDAPARP